MTEDEKSASEEDEGRDQQLPKLEKGEQADVREVASEEKETKPPRRYTDASLLGAMETAGKLVDDDELREAMKESGIGTPATRAAIIERLIDVGYVERDGRALVPTEKGMNVIRLLGDHKLTSPELTGEWEHRLGQIEEGSETRKKFMDDIAKFAGATVGELDAKLKDVRIPRANLGPCPVCGHDIVENRKGYSCWSREDPGCGFVIWKGKAGKQLPAAVARELIATGRTAKQVTGFKGRSGRSFRAKLALMQNEEGRWRVEFDEPWAKEGAKPPDEETPAPEAGGGRRAGGARPPRRALSGRRACVDPQGAVPLTLVTGPANAEKAGVVLDAYREQLARGAEPILVVPRYADVEHYRRELADGGAVFGVRVERFRGLIGEIARRAGLPGRPIGALARERAAAAAIAATRLDRLGPRRRRRASRRRCCGCSASSSSSGSTRRGSRRRCGPGRGDEARSAFAGELSALAFAYRAALDRLGRRDDELHTRRRSTRCGWSPALGRHAGALLRLRRPHAAAARRRRDARAPRAGDARADLRAGPRGVRRAARLHNDLLPLADEVIELEGRADHYAQPALHHLERNLFERQAGQAPSGVTRSCCSRPAASGPRSSRSRRTSRG